MFRRNGKNDEESGQTNACIRWLVPDDSISVYLRTNFNTFCLRFSFSIRHVKTKTLFSFYHLSIRSIFRPLPLPVRRRRARAFEV